MSIGVFFFSKTPKVQTPSICSGHGQTHYTYSKLRTNKWLQFATALQGRTTKEEIDVKVPDPNIANYVTVLILNIGGTLCISLETARVFAFYFSFGCITCVYIYIYVPNDPICSHCYNNQWRWFEITVRSYGIAIWFVSLNEVGWINVATLRRRPKERVFHTEVRKSDVKKLCRAGNVQTFKSPWSCCWRVASRANWSRSYFPLKILWLHSDKSVWLSLRK